MGVFGPSLPPRVYWLYDTIHCSMWLDLRKAPTLCLFHNWIMHLLVNCNSCGLENLYVQATSCYAQWKGHTLPTFGVSTMTMRITRGPNWLFMTHFKPKNFRWENKSKTLDFLVGGLRYKPGIKLKAVVQCSFRAEVLKHSKCLVFCVK